MTKINLEQLVIEHLQSAPFAGTLAEYISSHFGDDLMNEFTTLINTEMDRRVKALVAEYIEVYMTEEHIQSRVKTALQSITKAELLEKL